MAAVTLPSWLDADTIQNALLMAVIAMLLWAYVVARFARVIAGRVAAVLVAVVLVAVLLGARSGLRDCVREVDCSCSFVGLDVPLPDDLDRLRCA